MTQETPLEAFIPYRRADLIEMCVEDGKLNEHDVQQFRDFCEILVAYYHIKSQRNLEILKDSFAPFNPDSDTIPRQQLTPEQRDAYEEQLVQAFETVLQGANYTRLSNDDLQQAFAQESLIPLKTSVDFADYEQIIFYYRGDNFKTITVKKFFGLQHKEITIDNLERIALLIKFKDEAYFRQKDPKLNVEELNFTPGKMYLYIYKNVPRFDLELLFPNVHVSMNLIDKLLFILPAIGAAVPMILRVLPSIILIVAAVLFVTAGPQTAGIIDADVDQEQVGNIFALLSLALSVGVALGGFAVKQYTSYKNKRLQFLKKVTDTLFFKNLVTNQGVLYTLIDAAEEEECKEIILVYYHLLTSDTSFTRQQLDQHIEQWMAHHFQARLNFDIDKTLRNLAALRAPIGERLHAGNPERSLLQVDEHQQYRAVPINEAKAIIDHVWDNIFQYADAPAVKRIS